MHPQPVASVAAILLLTGCGSATPSAAVSAASFEGHWWRLTSVAHGGDIATVSAAPADILAFEGGHHLLIYDGINTLSASYATTPDGFRIVGDVTSTAAGYAGPPTAALEGLRSLSCTTIASSCQPSNAATRLTADGGLVVTTAGYELSFAATPPQPHIAGNVYPSTQ